MKIENYGDGERCIEAMRRLTEAAESASVADSVKRIILLPIPSSRDGVHISGKDILLSDLAESVSPGDLAVGYGIPKDILSAFSSRGALVFDAGECEEFLLENARITADGAIGYILSSFKRTPKDMTFGVIGYGRIASILVRYLLFFGARVRVYTSKEKTRLSLGECGVETVGIDYERKIDTSDIDVLINTAPRDMRTVLSGGCREGIIELASGNNFSSPEIFVP